MLIFIVLTTGLLIIDWQLTLGLSTNFISTYVLFILFTNPELNLIAEPKVLNTIASNESYKKRLGEFEK